MNNICTVKTEVQAQIPTCRTIFSWMDIGYIHADYAGVYDQVSVVTASSIQDPVVCTTHHVSYKASTTHINKLEQHANMTVHIKKDMYTE